VLLSASHLELTEAGAVADGPDLTVRFRQLARREVVGGTTAPASVVVANSRPARVRARPTTLGLYLSSDALLDGADRALETLTIRARLTPGQRVIKSLRLKVPADLASGTYHVLARVDEADTNAEIDEANNVADGGTLAYAAPVVDVAPLALKRVRLYFYRGLGVGGTATLLLRNDGNVDFVGTITGTVSVVYSPGNTGNTSVSYSQQVSIRRGARKVIRLRAEPAFSTGMSKCVCTATAAAPGDPTPGQSVSAPAQLILRDWFGRPHVLP
jgi:hypothetical protein